MGSRIPLDGEEDGDEPVVADLDHLRQRMDKSEMPAGEDRRRERAADRARSRDESSDSETGGRAYIEQQAVDMLVDTLKEKGVSQAFIQEHREKIREKALDRLYGRD